MLLFHCPNCGNRVYFENSLCARCGTALGYDIDANRFEAVGNSAVYCANAAEGACNWLVREGSPSAFCLSCRLNDIIPPIGDPNHHFRWVKVEEAKRRLVYGLKQLDLAVVPRAQAADGLAFHILVDDAHGGDRTVSMGHENGVITIDAAEADTPERESRRVELQEPFRTLLGHMRHESGHYYWDRLIRPTPWLSEFRELFGDDSADYSEAMNRYYAEGPPSDWQERFISAYAAMHPWEDWAESWAHYLHLTDAVETASAEGFWGAESGAGAAVGEVPFDALYDRWQDALLLMNSMNRSLGHGDFYPFVVSLVAKDKLRFVHDLVAQHRSMTTTSAPT